MKFCDMLRKRRNELDMTQVELAKAVGVSGRTIQLYEADEVIPKTAIAYRLADVLCIEFDVLLGYKERNIQEEIDKTITRIKNFFYDPDIPFEIKREIHQKALEIYYMSIQKESEKS